MFPICLKWIDDIYDNLESVYAHVDGIVSKEQEPSKYVEGLQNVGTNVNQFFSTVDPLKYVGDQLQTVGAAVEQSVDTMLSAINNIFPGEEDHDSTACKKSELKDHQLDNGDSISEPVTSAEMAGKFENSNFNLKDVITQTSQFGGAKSSSSIYDESCPDEDHNTGFYSPGQTAEVELKEKSNAPSPNKLQLDDESCVVIDKNDWFIYQVAVDDESPKIFQQIKIKSKTKSRINEERLPALPVSSSNDNTWESEWEIV